MRRLAQSRRIDRAYNVEKLKLEEEILIFLEEIKEVV